MAERFGLSAGHLAIEFVDAARIEALNAEYRGKPDDLAAVRESAAGDVFLAYAPLKYVSVVAAFTDLGRLAGKAPQRGAYVSLWTGF